MDHIRILIVDDHPMMREALTAALMEEADMNVVGQASEGHEAIQLLETCNPDIILMDVLMPGMDGLTASTVIRDYEASQGHRAFILGLSNGKVDWREYCIEAGMDHCLGKPVSREYLESLLHACGKSRVDRNGAGF